MRKFSWILIAVVIVTGFVAIVRGFAPGTHSVVEPIAFNHTVHLNDAGLSCSDCHLNAATSVSAGIPGKEICLNCHDSDEESGKNPEKDKLFAYADRDAQIKWIRVTMTRPDVFFSHRRHVASAGLDCLVCHKDQKELTRPPSHVRLVMKMADCINCHREKGVRHDCLTCHR